MSTLRVDPRRANPSEVLDRLRDGMSVVLDLEGPREATLRRSGETYYCDNGIRLTTYGTLDGMRQCLEELGIADGDDRGDRGD